MKKENDDVGKKGILRQKILAAARKLFNEKGYNEVSMRDISDSLGISVGNLTYHFKKKENLVEAVVLARHENYQRPEAPKTLEELNDCFRGVLRHQEDNIYYSRHYKQLSQISEKIYRIQKHVLDDLHDILEEAFGNLRQSGMMVPDMIPAQGEYLTQTILSICAYGTVLGGVNPLACIWSLIYPTLTEAGRSIYHSKIRTFLISNMSL
ncbi:MAG: TetR/AcrR family transcriptional regulator [Synergistaceae bacterium]|jgi:AcrR family transcriptional regulator|nr:TetR/AcrR family transcriptional regulator [Synergistaceae bacterium]